MKLGQCLAANLLLVVLLGADAAAESERRFSAQGRVEGASKTYTLSFAEAGRVETIEVAEGQVVRRGEILARLDCDVLEAKAAARSSELTRARASLARIRRGARREERDIAAARVAVQQARIRRLSRNHARLRKLKAGGSYVAVADLEDALLQLREAEAGLVVAERSLDLAEAGSPAEELAEASAGVGRAEAALAAAAGRLDYCVIVAPADGIILRQHIEAGVFVNTFYPSPVLSFVDAGAQRVRAEVDESEVEKVRIGQSVQVFARAFVGTWLSGRVVEKAGMMGRRRVLSGDPAEKMDRDVLEVLIALDAEAQPLPVGLRVRVVFLP